MNRIKQWDAQLDRWAESKWPGIIRVSICVVAEMVIAAIVLSVIAFTLSTYVK